MNKNFYSSKEKAKNEDVIPIKFALRPVKTYKLLKIAISDFKKYSFICQIGNQLIGKESFFQIILKFKDEEIVIYNENEWNEFIRGYFDETNVNKKIKQNIFKIEFEYINVVKNYVMNSSPEDIFNKLINAISNSSIIQHELKTYFEKEMKNSSNINNNEANSRNKKNFSLTDNYHKISVGELIVNKLINISTKINDINQVINDTNIISEDESDLFNKEESSDNDSSIDFLGNTVVSIIPSQQQIQMSVMEESNVISSNINEKFSKYVNESNLPNTINSKDIKTSSFSKHYNKNKKLIHEQILQDTNELSKRFSIYYTNNKSSEKENK